MWPFTKKADIVKNKDFIKKNNKKSFNSAKVGRLNNDFLSDINNINYDIYSSLTKVRGRSRNLSLNNDYYIRFLNLYRKNVIGANGFKLVSKVRDSNNEIDKKACDIIEKSWKEFCLGTNFSVDRKTSHNKFLQTCGWSYPRDGEFFVRLVYGFDNKFGFATQILLPDYLDETYTEELSNGNTIISGIEFNSWGEPINYYFTENNNKVNSMPVSKYSKKIKIPAHEIIHVFDSKEGGQARGFPIAQQALIKLHMINGTEDAELVSRRASACKMGFITPAEGGSYEGDGKDDEGNTISEMEAGIIERLENGDTFTPFDPKHQGDGNSVFVQSLLRSISSGFNFAYYAISNDFSGLTPEAIRIATIDHRDSCKIEQRFLIEEMEQRIFIEWLKISLMKRIIDLPFQNLISLKSITLWVEPLKQ